MSNRTLFDGSVELTPDSDLAEITLKLPASFGVCLFSDIQNRPILLLLAGNLRNVVRRRLSQESNEQKTRRVQLRPITARLHFRRTWSRFETQWAYFQIAREIYPDSLAELFGDLEAWFIRLDDRTDYPHFIGTNQPAWGQGRHWGPFPSRRKVKRTVDTLEGVFNLCRCPDVLAQAPQGQPCAYAQMNRCAVVCDGTVSKDAYRRIIDEAASFLTTPEQALDRMRSKMDTLARALKFEQAQELKEKIAQAQPLCGKGYRWVELLENFYVFALETGPPIKPATGRGLLRSVQPFLIGPGWLRKIEPFLLEQAGDACQALLDHWHLAQMQEPVATSDETRRLFFGWISNILYRQSRLKGLYIRPGNQTTAEDLARLVTEHFSRKTKSSSKPALDSIGLSEHSEGQDSGST